MSEEIESLTPDLQRPALGAQIEAMAGIGISSADARLILSENLQRLAVTTRSARPPGYSAN